MPYYRYDKSSYGQFTIPEDVGHTVTANIDATMDVLWSTVGPDTKCNPAANAWQQQVYTLADQAVFDSDGIAIPGGDEDNWQDTAYTHRMYLLPNNPVPSQAIYPNWPADCSWDGVADIIGRRSYVGAWKFAVLAHELGHNLGLGDAATDTNNDGGKESSYGDGSAVMGYNVYWKELNAPNRRRLGWIPDAAVHTTNSADTCTPHKVSIASLSSSPLESNGQTPAATGKFTLVEVASPTHDQASSKQQAWDTRYFVSFRVNTGASSGGNLDYDSGMKEEYANQVFLHWGKSSDQRGGSSSSHLIVGLTSGQSYASGDGNLKVKVMDMSTATNDAVATVCFYCTNTAECNAADVTEICPQGSDHCATTTTTTTAAPTTEAAATQAPTPPPPTPAPPPPPEAADCGWYEGNAEVFQLREVTLDPVVAPPARMHMVKDFTVNAQIKFNRRIYGFEPNDFNVVSTIKWIAKQGSRELWSSSELESAVSKKYKVGDTVDISFQLPSDVDYAQAITIDAEVWSTNIAGGSVKCHDSSSSTLTIEATTLPCDDFEPSVFKLYGSNTAVCGATKVKAKCKDISSVTYTEAKGICESIGARLCSSVELRADVARGTGCGLDVQPPNKNNRYVWTTDSCTDSDGNSGMRAVEGSSLEDEIEQCVKDSDKDSVKQNLYARCCANANGIPFGAVGQQCSVPPCREFEVIDAETVAPWTGNDDDYANPADEIDEPPTLPATDPPADDDDNLSDTVSVDSVEGPEEVAPDTPAELELVAGLPRNVTLRMALVTLDEVDPAVVFRQRAAVMKSVPHFLQCPFRNALGRF